MQLGEEIRNVIEKADRGTIRQFGWILAAFFGLLSFLLYWRHHTSPLYLTALGVVIALLALVWPQALRPIYAVWMSVAVTLGYLMTRLVLTLLFAVVFVPAGLVIRLLGRDPLDQKWHDGRSSYWIRRPRKPFDRSAAEKQF